MHTTLKVLVCDCAAALELAGSSLLAAAGAWKLKLAVSDLLFERELRDCAASVAQCKPFRVERLSAQELQGALALRRLHKQLSLCDACTLSLAAQRSWVLLTAEKSLARLAGELALDVRDLEWLSRELARLEDLSSQQRVRRLAPSIADGHHFYGGIGQVSV